MYQNSR
jgi:hypothetical protein